MKLFIKKNIKFIIVILICITCSILTTFATDYLFNSNEVKYNNTTSGIQAGDVQGAIDELYACASNYAAYNQRLTNVENTMIISNGFETLPASGTGTYPQISTSTGIRLNAKNGPIQLITNGSNGNIQGYSSAGAAWGTFLGGAFTVQSSRFTKENIQPLNKTEAKKILAINPVSFDYKKNFGGQKNQFGLIAEDVEKIIPYAVFTPENYDELKFDESKGIQQPIKSIDYSKFVPYLIKMIQIQQDEINELREKLK